MVVVTLTDCPPALRGDLSKWLQEVSTNVYVGRVSARVRDAIWLRIQENAGSGRATMVFSMNNEQGLDFRVCNSSWEPIDFDGLKLMLHPSPARLQKRSIRNSKGYSDAGRMRFAKNASRRAQKRTPPLPMNYVVLDLETTGLSSAEDVIIEIAAIKVVEGVESSFDVLIRADVSVPPAIEALTGISDEMLGCDGQDLCEVLPEFFVFLEDYTVVSHNTDFDLGFLREGCRRCGFAMFSNRCIDTLFLARQLVDDVRDYKLQTLLSYFGMETETVHRGLADCMSTRRLYEKLNELSMSDV